MSTTDGISITDLAWQPGNEAGQPPRFDGEVRRAAIAQSPQLAVSLVQFIAGARTYWHTHPSEQVLVVVEGECRVRIGEGQEQVAHAGQVVRLPAGAEHWHGAVPGATMTHLSITTGGGAAWSGPPTPR